MDERPSATSGHKGYLLTAAKSGVMVPARRTRATGRVALLLIAVFFIAVGFLDLVLAALAAPLDTPLAPAPIESGAERGGIEPMLLEIRSLGIVAKVQHVGLNAAGNMAVPSNYTDVAWFSPGTRPGDRGNAVIAGHLDNSLGLAGIFENLHRLRIGDVVSVRDIGGSARTFRVKEMTVHDAASVAGEEIFAGDGARNLVLITCNGAWDKARKTYDKRLVIVAELI